MTKKDDKRERLRDFFAVQAMNALIIGMKWKEDTVEDACADAYTFANAMMVEREKHFEKPYLSDMCDPHTNRKTLEYKPEKKDWTKEEIMDKFNELIDTLKGIEK